MTSPFQFGLFVGWFVHLQRIITRNLLLFSSSAWHLKCRVSHLVEKLHKLKSARFVTDDVYRWSGTCGIFGSSLSRVTICFLVLKTSHWLLCLYRSSCVCPNIGRQHGRVMEIACYCRRRSNHLDISNEKSFICIQHSVDCAIILLCHICSYLARVHEWTQ